MLRNVRAGGQGVKRGQFEGLKEGTREMKELRKRARAAERLRRYDDGQSVFAFVGVRLVGVVDERSIHGDWYSL